LIDLIDLLIGKSIDYNNNSIELNVIH